jgi:hypothetical protein
MSAYDRLAEIAHHLEPLGYLAAYKADLTTHDKARLDRATPDESFVWLIRQSGTELFPVGAGMHAAWLTYWLDPAHVCGPPPLCYFVQGETVKAISHKAANTLANRPHPEGHRIVVDFATMSSWIEDAHGLRIAA